MFHDIYTFVGGINEPEIYLKTCDLKITVIFVNWKKRKANKPRPFFPIFYNKWRNVVPAMWKIGGFFESAVIKSIIEGFG